jgi:hypothetical protein
MGISLMIVLIQNVMKILIKNVLGLVFLASSVSKVLTCFESINTNKFISVKLNSFKKSVQLNHCWQKLSLRHSALFSHTISQNMFPVWCIYGARISSCLEQMEAM